MSAKWKEKLKVFPWHRTKVGKMSIVCFPRGTIMKMSLNVNKDSRLALSLRNFCLTFSQIVLAW